MRRAKWIALVAAGLLVVVAGLAVWNLSAIVRWAMTPSGPFDPSGTPRAPDYADPASWSALPDRDDAADAVPVGVAAVDQRAAPVDVFYVHPTTYVGSRWNASADDAKLNADTDRVATRIQATAFNGCCAVYAPRYRQTNGLPFAAPTADGDRAVEVAYDDVRRAFASFQARRGADRPFILAGHSQGAVLAERLLEEEISRKPPRDRMVAAYLIAGRVTVEGLRQRVPDIPPCGEPAQVRCVVAWSSRSPTHVPNEWELRPRDPGTRLCTNPLTWRLDGQPAPASANAGAVFMETENRAPRRAFADATCVDGTLRVSSIGDVPRDLMSRILDHVLGAGNYHPIEVQLFFMNLRENANLRAAAMTRR